MSEDGGIVLVSRRKVDGYRKRIEELEGVLRWIEDQEPATCEVTVLHQVCQTARAALKENSDE